MSDETTPSFRSAPPAPAAAATAGGVSDKSRTVALVLCLVIGVLGIHRFYVGKTGTGIAMILTGSFKDMQGRELKTW